jgi:hypothetical protein
MRSEEIYSYSGGAHRRRPAAAEMYARTPYREAEKQPQFAGAFQHADEVLRATKLPVRLDDDRHAGGRSIFAQVMKSVADPAEGHTLVLDGDELIREHTNIWSVQFLGERDEAASLVHMFRSFRPIVVVVPIAPPSVG